MFQSKHREGRHVGRLSAPIGYAALHPRQRVPKILGTCVPTLWLRPISLRAPLPGRRFKHGARLPQRTGVPFATAPIRMADCA